MQQGNLVMMSLQICQMTYTKVATFLKTYLNRLSSFSQVGTTPLKTYLNKFFFKIPLCGSHTPNNLLKSVIFIPLVVTGV